MPDLRHSERCPICGGTGSVLVENNRDQGPIYEACPIAEDEWLRRQHPWSTTNDRPAA